MKLTELIGRKIVLGNGVCIYDSYNSLSDLAREVYGKKTVCFMQVGDFYEAYYVRGKDPSGLSELADEFLMTSSTKSNGITMVGFPLLSEERYVESFLGKGWSVCVVDQIMDNSIDPMADSAGMTDQEFYSATNKGRSMRKVLYRIVRAVYTPGSREDTTESVNNLVCIYYKMTRGKSVVGMCCLELKTGSITLQEVHSDSGNPNYLNEEMYKFVTAGTPKEVRLFLSDTGKLSKEHFDSVLRRDVIIATANPRVSGMSYREEVLYNIYKDLIPGLQEFQVSLHTYFDLVTHEYSARAFIECINYIHSTNRQLLQKILPPEQFRTSDTLGIHYNASDQLNLVGAGKCKSLFGILNETITDIGNYNIHRLHVHPITCVDTLNDRYDIVEKLIGSPDITKALSVSLSGMKWISRLQSKLATGKIDNRSLYNLFQGYTHFKNVHDLLPEVGIPGLSDPAALAEMLTVIQESLSESAMSKAPVNFVESLRDLDDLAGTLDLVLDTIHITDKTSLPRLREYTAELKEEIKKVNAFVKDLEDYILKKKKSPKYIRYVSVRYTQKCGTASFRVQTTEIGKRNLAGFPGITVSANKDSKTKFDITAPGITESLLHIGRLMYCLLHTQEHIVRTFCAELYTKYRSVLLEILEVTGLSDTLLSFARVSQKYNYCKPRAHSADTAYFDAKNLRHPLIERILYANGGSAYVPNDISVGIPSDSGGSGVSGILLYSMNGVGKSSLMKAVGNAVFMAQMGCFVSATQFTFSPYTRIMTRIDSTDDMFQGMSSFSKEITELSSIVLQADSRTLVLADEICKGTESDSAYAITAATIEHLCTTGSSFILSSHIHEIATSQLLREHTRIRVCHLNVIETEDGIIYSRKLEDGKCKDLYGVEIARILGYPQSILARAEVYRDEKLNRVSVAVNDTACPYNKNFFANECLRCGDSDKDKLDTHHVIPQHSADSQGYVITGLGNKIHKDDTSNLVRLCKRCHREFHNKGTFRIVSENKARRVIHSVIPEFE